ncbi:MAG: TIGR03619 family F420-dependent LLM class oxidoreductase [Acidimicrobiales bacterium]
MKFCFALSFSALDQYVPLAVAGDEHGFEAVACSDHLVNPEVLTAPYPYTEDGSRRWEPFTDWPDPFVAIGAMAAATKRLRFFTNVFALPLRSPFVVAKAVGTAAVLSGNRVSLGIGMGSLEDEFAIVDAPWKGRGKRADEMIEVLRTLWSGGWVEHHGEHYDFAKLEMSPTPTEQPPIYVGGLSEVALRRAARNDGWISDLHTTAELAAFRGRLDALRADCGRSAEPFAMVGSCTDAYDLDGYRRLEEAGVTHLLTLPWIFYGGYTDDLQQRVDGIKRFADDIIANFD